MTAAMLAAQQQGLMVLIDDGKDLALKKGLTVHSTEDLLAEMVASGALPKRRGFLTDTRVYGSNEAAFDAAVAAATACGA